MPDLGAVIKIGRSWNNEPSKGSIYWRPLQHPSMTGPASDHLREIAEHYRQRATECRTKAELTDGEWARRSFHESAEFWMRLGVQAARRIQGSNGQHVNTEHKPGEENVD